MGEAFEISPVTPQQTLSGLSGQRQQFVAGQICGLQISVLLLHIDMYLRYFYSFPTKRLLVCVCTTRRNGKASLKPHECSFKLLENSQKIINDYNDTNAQSRWAGLSQSFQHQNFLMKHIVCLQEIRWNNLKSLQNNQPLRIVRFSAWLKIRSECVAAPAKCLAAAWI